MYNLSAYDRTIVVNINFALQWKTETADNKLAILLKLRLWLFSPLPSGKTTDRGHHRPSNSVPAVR